MTVVIGYPPTKDEEHPRRVDAPIRQKRLLYSPRAVLSEVLQYEVRNVDVRHDRILELGIRRFHWRRVLPVLGDLDRLCGGWQLRILPCFGLVLGQQQAVVL